MRFSDLVIDRVSDADFNNILMGVQFSTTPREAVTVGDMINHYDYKYIQEMYELRNGQLEKVEVKR